MNGPADPGGVRGGPDIAVICKPRNQDQLGEDASLTTTTR